jgi:hypothetical protein
MKIAILDKFNAFGEKLAGRIRQEFVDYEVITAVDIDQISAVTDDIDILITWPLLMSGSKISAKNAPSLKWIQAFTPASRGLSGLLLDSWTSR